MKTATTTVSQQRLRDLAPRAVRVVVEHKGLHPSVEAVAPSLVPAAEAYIAVYDEALVSSAVQRRDMEAGRVALSELARQIRAGLPIVQHAMPTFDASVLAGTVETPERLLSDGQRLIELIEQGDVPQGEAITALVKAALEKAEPEWAKAQNARRALQVKQTEVRQQALLLNRELVTLRKVLRTVVGTSDLAYQTLRTSRVSNPDLIDEDDSVVSDTEDDTAAPAATNGATTNGKSHGAAFNLGALA